MGRKRVDAFGERLLPAPLLKWAGGKSELLPKILNRLPEKIGGVYYEPFVGGGAVFFALEREKRIGRACLFDANAELIDCYRAVRDDVVGVVRALGRHRNDEDYFYEVRAQKPADLALVERAARTIFLNRAGYNGLYRVNSKGQFNVPFGRYAKPRIIDEELLASVSEHLRGVRLEVADFEAACATATRGDVVYFDPPYVPVSPTASFTRYAQGDFGKKDHERLARVFGSLVDRGVHVLLSNSDVPLTRELYQRWHIASVKASRAINSKGERRGEVGEILVSGRAAR